MLTEAETLTLQQVRDFARADQVRPVIDTLGPLIHAALADGRGSRPFLGTGFDVLCRAILSAEGLGEPSRVRIADLCARSEDRFGAQPWSMLYRACLAHLAGDRDAAATLYQAAGAETDILWPSSVGSRSVIGSGDLAAWRTADPSTITPARIEHRGATGTSVLFVACDAVYLRAFAPAYLRSVATWAPEASLHIHLVDPAAGDLAWIESAARDLWSRISISSEVYAGPDRRTWYAMTRFVRLPQILDMYDRPVAVSDIDAAFTRPLDALATGGDIGFRIKRAGFRAHPWQTVQAGALTVRPTPDGIAAAQLLKRLAVGMFDARGGRGLWFADQNVLFSGWRALVEEGHVRIDDISGQALPGGLVFGKSL